MSIEIKVPPLGESISEATIARLLKKEGDYVEQDEMIAELETDKVTLEINAPSAGVIEKLSVKEGDDVKVNAIIGIINEKAKSDDNNKSKSDNDKSEPTGSKDESKSSSQEKEGNIYSPAAQKIATEKNISVSQGSGKDGRVTKQDAVNASNETQNKPQNKGAASNNERFEERVKMTKLRQIIAQRLKDSQNTAAILTTFNEVDMTNIMELRAKYKDEFEKKHGTKLGFMSFFIKAAIKALKEIPSVNAQIENNEIIYKHYYDIGVAVGGPQGLVVPVVRNADNLSFAEIESTIVALGQKAKNGALTVDDMTGGTFTVSNGGVFGSLLSTPIINPPQTGILGLHKIQDRAMVINKEIKIRPMMYTALSYDHRLIDGKEAVTFLVKIKEAIEDPQVLLLDL